jgi:hypothetical protein
MRRALFYLSMVAAVGYGGLLIWKTSFAVGGSDSSGYANTAKMIAGGHIVAPVEGPGRLDLPDRFNRAFIPLAFEPGQQPRTMVPYYPPGYPLHLAAAGVFGGWEYAPFLVSPLAALLLLWATYALARELSLSRPLASIASAILGGCAVLLFQAVQPMSDVVAAAWATASVLFALRARRRDAWAVLSGAALGMAVLTRPTNILLVVPLAFALPWRPKAVTLFAAAGLPFAAFHMAWNAKAFGSPWRTGYSGQLDGFAWGNFPERFVHYGRTLGQMFSPLVPLGWLGAGVDRLLPGRDRALLLAWFASYFGLYCFWGPYETWWYARYLLPALPALVIAAVAVARDLLRRLAGVSPGPLRTRLALAGAVLLFAVVALAERRSIRDWKPLEITEGQRIFPLSMDLVRSQVPDRSLIVSMDLSGALRYYTNFQPVRWDWLEPADFAVVRAKAESKGYRLYALLFPWEEKELAAHAPGKWKRVGTVGNVILWELE